MLYRPARIFNEGPGSLGRDLDSLRSPSVPDFDLAYLVFHIGHNFPPIQTSPSIGRPDPNPNPISSESALGVKDPTAIFDYNTAWAEHWAGKAVRREPVGRVRVRACQERWASRLVVPRRPELSYGDGWRWGRGEECSGNEDEERGGQESGEEGVSGDGEATGGCGRRRRHQFRVRRGVKRYAAGGRDRYCVSIPKYFVLSGVAGVEVLRGGEQRVESHEGSGDGGLERSGLRPVTDLCVFSPTSSPVVIVSPARPPFCTEQKKHVKKAWQKHDCSRALSIQTQIDRQIGSRSIADWGERVDATGWLESELVVVKRRSSGDGGCRRRDNADADYIIAFLPIGLSTWASGSMPFEP
ncbi:hypothetical protein B0H16DRAFT_1807662 [Mycena metata]|uniref:Uncharacterized protein n=1 Tax=Mycena metata TaxID=1033252 RepID=A0AAD7H803_9AGAR|nr:hypothetical protein B0H16DRAFT_1807662 [Mycena metata]